MLCVKHIVISVEGVVIMYVVCQTYCHHCEKSCHSVICLSKRNPLYNIIIYESSWWCCRLLL